MIDSPIFYAILTFLPATLGFLGCVFHRIFFPICLAYLVGLSAFSIAGIFNAWETSFTLMWIGGIQFSFDQFTYPLLFGTSFSLFTSLLLFRKQLSHYFYQISFVLLTALTVAFSAVDLISIYIALELTGFCAFLLIADRNDHKSLFLSFQYLIGGGLAMLIYLIGVIGAFQFSATFLIRDLSFATPIALCLIIAGLMTKAGIFICGLWVPNIYSHASPQSSAILAGCVTCAGIAPIARMSGDLVPIANSMVVIGVLSAVVAALYAVFERDDGRALGWSSVSQLGLAILSPTYACIYAMQHGVCKALLFSTLTPKDPPAHHEQSNHHSADQETQSNVSTFQNYASLIVFVTASLSVMAFPLTSGFITKSLLKGDIPTNAKIIVSTSTLLTTTVYVRLIWSRIQVFLGFRREIMAKKYHNKTSSFYTNQIFLIISSIAIISFSIADRSVLTYDNIVNALTATGLGIILYASVVGLQTVKIVKPVTRTLDLVGAPFVVAALLLANLLYFKI
ncbi:MAG: proton-conducting transporter membrane subunit [Cyanobacteriota bacterium]|nr:proton-conducting transporter membrane subunit [Cyanobacteriota bacterium]